MTLLRGVLLLLLDSYLFYLYIYIEVVNVYRFVVHYELLKNGVQSHFSNLYSKDLATNLEFEFVSSLESLGFTIHDHYLERIK